MKKSPVSCGTPAIGGEERTGRKPGRRQTHFKSRSFSGSAVAFLTPPLHTALVLSQPALLSLQPCIAGKMKSPGLDTATKAEGWRRRMPCRHPSGTPADGRCRQLCPSVLPPTGRGRCTQRGSCSLRGHVAMSPRLSSGQNKRQPSVASRAMSLHDLLQSSALPTLGSSMNTADIFQPCTLTVYRHGLFNSPSEVLLQPPAQRKEKLASGILGIQIIILNLVSIF